MNKNIKIAVIAIDMEAAIRMSIYRFRLSMAKKMKVEIITARAMVVYIMVLWLP